MDTVDKLHGDVVLTDGRRLGNVAQQSAANAPLQRHEAAARRPDLPRVTRPLPGPRSRFFVTVTRNGRARSAPAVRCGYQAGPQHPVETGAASVSTAGGAAQLPRPRR